MEFYCICLFVMGLFHLIMLEHTEVLKHNDNAVVLLSLYARLVFFFICMKKHFMHLEKSVEE